MNFDKNKLKGYIKKLVEPKVLIVGDLALDEMMYGDCERISREAPVLILQHTHTNYILGGASNAAHNVAALNGGKATVIGVCGEDYHADFLFDTFKKANVSTQGLIRDKSRKTITKTRISGACSQSVTQQIVRIDRQTNAPISKECEDIVIKKLEKLIPEHDAVILSNYHIGTLTQSVIDKAIELANKYKKVIVVDAQKELERYKNITSMTPNLPDTQKSVGFVLKEDEDFEKAGNILLNLTKSKSVLITCGDRGMVVVEKGDVFHKIPVFNKSEVFDVTGAGDTVTAVYTMALAIGAEPLYAAIIGNIAASLVVKQYGCATTTVDEILLCGENL